MVNVSNVSCLCAGLLCCTDIVRGRVGVRFCWIKNAFGLVRILASLDAFIGSWVACTNESIILINDISIKPTVNDLYSI